MQEAEDIDTGVDTRTKKEMLAEQMAGLKSTGKFIGETAVESIPGVGQAIGVKRTSDALEEDDYVGAGIEGTALVASMFPGIGPAAAKGLRKFNKTRKAYKLLVQKPDSKLYPLFVQANKNLPEGEWLEAEFPETAFLGKTAKSDEARLYVPTKGAEREPKLYFLDDKQISKEQYDALGNNRKPDVKVIKGEKTKGTGTQIRVPDKATADKLKNEGFKVSKPTEKAPHGTVEAVAGRGGFHASQAPVATHLGPEDIVVSNEEVTKLLDAGMTPDAVKTKVFSYTPDGKPISKENIKKLSKEEQAKVVKKPVNYIKRRAEDQVFAVVDMADDVDYQSMLAKEGKTDLRDGVPKGGSYRYSDGQADSDQWVVGGDMKIQRVLSREEARAIQKEKNVTDLLYKDEIENILGRKFSDKTSVPKKVKLEKFEPAKAAQINKSWWLDKDTVTLYHGTNKRNLKNIKDTGLQPDSEGFIYLTPDPNTAAGYASMSATGGEKTFRKSGKARHTPEEERVILKYEIPKEEFMKYLDMSQQRYNPLNPKYKPEEDKLFNKDVFEKHMKSKSKDAYYSTTEVRFPDSGAFDQYLTSVSNRKNALTEKELDMAKGGVVMDDYLVAKMMDENDSRQKFAEGGMPKQMEMFEDGGLKDEGGTVDPVSGNDVPPGSTQEEVRDDIPAQLSEGEFVFPADVVRYIGLGNLMRIRQEAKMGLKMMEEMGQMGNSDEATMPDDLPFDINDLDMEDEIDDNKELEMQVGGFVQPTQQQEQMGISGYQQAAAPTTGVAAVPQQAASQQYVQPVQPVQAAVPTMTAYKPSEVPTFQQTIGDDAFGTYDELRQYKNEAGNIINVPFRNGQPISPIPEGYTFVDLRLQHHRLLLYVKMAVMPTTLNQKKKSTVRVVDVMVLVMKFMVSHLII